MELTNDSNIQHGNMFQSRDEPRSQNQDLQEGDGDENSTDGEVVKRKLIDVKKLVPEVTNELLKNCNIVRDKSIGSKHLYSRTGKIAGAKDGVNFVNEPFMRQNQAKSSSNLR